jgi:hypothetical protein
MEMEINNKEMPLPVDYFWNQRKVTETAQESHVINVYEDPDFVSDVRTALPEYLSHIDIKGNNVMPDGTRKPHEKLRYFRVIEKLDDTLFMEVASKYAVTANDIKIYLMGLHHTGEVFGKRQDYRLKPDHKGGWIATFSVNIKEEEFKKMWAKVKRNKRFVNSGKMPKAKPPIYDKLLYAIFKARQTEPKPTTFKAIFDLYKDKKLPNYKGPTKMFTSEDKLEDYYRKHKPSP